METEESESWNGKLKRKSEAETESYLKYHRCMARNVIMDLITVMSSILKCLLVE